MRNTAFHLFLDCYCFLFIWSLIHELFLWILILIYQFSETQTGKGFLIFWLFDFLLVNIRILTNVYCFERGQSGTASGICTIWKIDFHLKIPLKFAVLLSVGWSMIIVSGSGYWLIFLTQFLYFDESHSKKLIFFFTFSLILTIFFQEVDPCLSCLDKNISRFLNRNVENFWVSQVGKQILFFVLESVSGIRCLFYPWIWDGSKIKIWIRDEHLGPYFRELRHNFMS